MQVLSMCYFHLQLYMNLVTSQLSDHLDTWGHWVRSINKNNTWLVLIKLSLMNWMSLIRSLDWGSGHLVYFCEQYFNAFYEWY